MSKKQCRKSKEDGEGRRGVRQKMEHNGKMLQATNKKIKNKNRDKKQEEEEQIEEKFETKSRIPR